MKKRAKPKSSALDRVAPANRRNEIPASKPDLLILQALRRIIRAVDMHSRKLTHSYGITGPQLVCLKTLIDEGPMSLTTLARRVHVGGSTITGIIDRLVAKGLVLRVQDAGDRRRSVVSATKKASGFVSKAPSPLQETFATRLAKLPELEQAAIAMSLQRIVHLMEAEDIDAAPILHGSERLADDPA